MDRKDGEPILRPHDVTIEASITTEVDWATYLRLLYGTQPIRGEVIGGPHGPARSISAMSKARQLDPWEPDPKWHPARVEAFVRYRDMGAERSITQVARVLHKARPMIGKWSRENGWVERCAAWDAECDRVRREEFADTSAQLGEQLATDAENLRAALLLPAKAVQRRIVEAAARGEDPFDGVSNAEMIRLAATAGRAFAQVAHVERLAHGQSTDNIGGHDGGALVGADVADKSPEAIQAYLTGRADALREREEETADA